MSLISTEHQKAGNLESYLGVEHTLVIQPVISAGQHPILLI